MVVSIGTYLDIPTGNNKEEVKALGLGIDEYMNYSSMVKLWNNRDKHNIFMVGRFMCNVQLGLPSLYEYCKNHNKHLLINIHQCLSSCVDKH